MNKMTDTLSDEFLHIQYRKYGVKLEQVTSI